MLVGGDAQRAPDSPGAIPAGRLQTFFDALAAGQEMSSVTRLLRNAMLQHAGTCERQRSTPAQPSCVLSPCKTNPAPVLTSSVSCMSYDGGGGEKEDMRIRRFWDATKAALLFSVESSAATEEATLLYYAPETWSCLRCNRATFAATVVTGGMGACDVPALLSSRITTELARQRLRETHDWQRALAMLRSVDRTPFSVALAIELCGRGGLWQEALEQLDSVAEEQWTEMDVAGAMRAMYHAARVARQQQGRQRRGRGWRQGQCMDAPQSLVSVPAAQMPMCLLRRCAEHGVRLSAPSAVNDAIGMLSLLPASAAGWHAACELLDALTLERTPAATHEEDGDKKCAANEAALGSARLMSYPLSSLLVRANVVTVYQVCAALQAHWELALHYTATLQRRYGIAIEHDRATVQRVLHACVSGRRWQEAMSLTQRFIRHCAEAKRSADSRSGGSSPFLSPDLFLALVLLFNQTGHADAAQRLLRHASITRSYHGHIVRHAYNTMLQHAVTVDMAEIYKARLEGLGGSGVDGAASTTERHAAHEVRGDVVANASYEHLTTLYAMDGRWLDALRCFHHVTRRALRPDTKHQLRYQPTAQLHDTIQYALEQVPLPGPPWSLSVQIFTQMLTLQAPPSPIAMQCVWRKCVKHGAFAQAQQVLAFCLRKGIQR